MPPKTKTKLPDVVETTPFTRTKREELKRLGYMRLAKKPGEPYYVWEQQPCGETGANSPYEPSGKEHYYWGRGRGPPKCPTRPARTRRGKKNDEGTKRCQLTYALLKEPWRSTRKPQPKFIARAKKIKGMGIKAMA